MKNGLAPLFLMFVGACGHAPEASFDCTAEYVYAINLTVVDGTSGEAVEGITGWVRDGEFVEPLEVADRGGVAYAAGERPGTYAIEVRAPGYQPWDTAGIVATADQCHVHPRRIDVVLLPGVE
jgi:hypothetical protein